MLAEWLPLCETQGDHFCVMLRMLHRVQSYMYVYICTQIHSCAHPYGTNVLIMLLIYRCMHLYIQYKMYAKQHTCFCECVCAYPPVCTHISAILLPLFLLSRTTLFLQTVWQGSSCWWQKYGYFCHGFPKGKHFNIANERYFISRYAGI